MRLHQLLLHLRSAHSIHLYLPDGSPIPPHFHITEIGKVTRDFIDCGGKRRTHTFVNMQILVAQDYDHRLSPKKLRDIIGRTAAALEFGDQEVRFEYQRGSISTYGAAIQKDGIQLIALETACLAADHCGIPEKVKLSLSELNTKTCCESSGCC